jgi:hypothetical protein
MDLLLRIGHAIILAVDTTAGAAGLALGIPGLAGPTTHPALSLRIRGTPDVALEQLPGCRRGAARSSTCGAPGGGRAFCRHILFGGQRTSFLASSK